MVSSSAAEAAPARSAKEAPRRGIKPRLPAPGTPMDIVFLSPNETGRRFPLLTDAHWKLVAIGIGLLVLLLVIVYLVWREDERAESSPLDQSALAAPPIQVMRPSAEPRPTLPPLVPPIDAPRDEPAVVETPRPEPPVQVNAVEAKLLDDALRRQIREEEKKNEERSEAERQKQLEHQKQQEAERQRRELAAARQREEELAWRKAAEEKLRLETEAFEKRRRELEQAEAERRSRAEEARRQANVLHSGTVAWSGMVDGVDEVVLLDATSTVRHISGQPPRQVRASFSAPIPRSSIKVDLISTNGRSPIQILQQPSTANGYATVVRIDDSAKGGDQRYDFTLRWKRE
ncbi:MAG TPA: hypothetical protein VJ302_03520 [Blastocatellia bacterium]|nr:hypothetical protein [Blastocatellia bacterium]